MRHMPPFIAKIGEALWRAAYHKLPPRCRERLPNMCVLQTYSRQRGDFMDYHTDARQTYYGQRIAQVFRGWRRAGHVHHLGWRRAGHVHHLVARVRTPVLRHLV
jgi:hypothetical protein